MGRNVHFSSAAHASHYSLHRWVCWAKNCVIFGLEGRRGGEGLCTVW
jgi:hypothetical protein